MKSFTWVMINILNFNMNLTMIFFSKKNLCIVIKFALSQFPIAKFQTPILEFSVNALLNYAIQMLLTII